MPRGGVTAHATVTKKSKGLSMRLTGGEMSRRVVGLFGPREYSNHFGQEEVVMRKSWAVSLPVSALLVWTLSAGPARVYGQQPGSSAPQETAVSFPAASLDQQAKAEEPRRAEEAKKPEEAKKAEKPEEEKAFADVVKDMEAIKGLFTYYRKADDNKILMEILPDQLDKMLLFAASIDQAVGERGLYASMMGGDFPIVFHRVGKNIQWVMKNTRFIAASGTPAARFTANTMPVE